MTIKISTTVGTPSYTSAASAFYNCPIVCWENLANVASYTQITGSAAYAGEVPSNLWNSSTVSRFRCPTSGGNPTVTIMIDLGTNRLVDSVCIGGHNLVTTGGAVTVAVGDPTQPTAPTVVSSAAQTTGRDGQPFMILFAQSTLIRYVKITITVSVYIPLVISNIIVGKSLLLERRIGVGHRPEVYNVSTERQNQRTESSQFAPSIVLGRSAAAEIKQQNATRLYFDTNVAAFHQHVTEAPNRPNAATTGHAPNYYYAWRPIDFPDDTAYCVPTSELTTSVVHHVGFLDWELSAMALY